MGAMGGTSWYGCAHWGKNRGPSEFQSPQLKGALSKLLDCPKLMRRIGSVKTLKSDSAGATSKRIPGPGTWDLSFSYLLNHWLKLTLFLRQAGSPIDNNIVERALKKAILNRKNALFYRTLNGAGVGDLFMSLIHTCELNGANPFDYLTELLRHTAELKQRPSEWMPWNYRDTLAQLATPAAA